MQKKIKKKVDKKCYFCNEDDYNLLDVHRILPGEKNGKYTQNNTVVCCANCHRRIHAGQIKIDRWCLSTKGRVLHYFMEGEERFD